MFTGNQLPAINKYNDKSSPWKELSNQTREEDQRSTVSYIVCLVVLAAMLYPVADRRVENALARRWTARLLYKHQLWALKALFWLMWKAIEEYYFSLCSNNKYLCLLFQYKYIIFSIDFLNHTVLMKMKNFVTVFLGDFQNIVRVNRFIWRIGMPYSINKILNI